MRSIFTVASKVRNGIFTALAGTLALGGLACDWLYYDPSSISEGPTFRGL